MKWNFRAGQLIVNDNCLYILTLWIRYFLIYRDWDTKLIVI